MKKYSRAEKRKRVVASNVQNRSAIYSNVTKMSKKLKNNTCGRVRYRRSHPLWTTFIPPKFLICFFFFCVCNNFWYCSLVVRLYINKGSSSYFTWNLSEFKGINSPKLFLGLVPTNRDSFPHFLLLNWFSSIYIQVKLVLLNPGFIIPSSPVHFRKL